MDIVELFFGSVLTALALLDIYLTVLHARIGTSILSERISRWTWRGFRLLGDCLPRLRDPVLAFCGPTLLVLIMLVWAVMLICGFALIVWPALGWEIKASSGVTPTDYMTAIYFSAGSFTTAGIPGLLPISGAYKALFAIEGTLGVASVTMIVTYFLRIYTALLRRNDFAQTLHHGTRGTGDAAELLAALGAGDNFDASRGELSDIVQLLIKFYESHDFYPSLIFFRFGEIRYALSRMTLIVMDMAALIRSALGEQHESLRHSAAVVQLQGTGQELLEDLSGEFLRGPYSVDQKDPDEQTLAIWRARYFDAVQKLADAGISVTADLHAGAVRYIADRKKWDAQVTAFAGFMSRSIEDVDVAASRFNGDESAGKAP